MSALVKLSQQAIANRCLAEAVPAELAAGRPRALRIIAAPVAGPGPAWAPGGRAAFASTFPDFPR